MKKNNYYGIIYRATNLVNGKVYIGQTIQSLDQRKKEHIRVVNRHKRTGAIKGMFAFQKALLKYGFNNFKWEIIDHASSHEDIDTKEMYWVQFYKSFYKKHGYNQTE